MSTSPDLLSDTNELPPWRRGDRVRIFPPSRRLHLCNRAQRPLPQCTALPLHPPVQVPSTHPAHKPACSGSAFQSAPQPTPPTPFHPKASTHCIPPPSPSVHTHSQKPRSAAAPASTSLQSPPLAVLPPQ